MTHKYLFDTNVLAALARNPAGPVASKSAQVGEASLCTSIIVVCEVHYGLAKRASPRLVVLTGPSETAITRECRQHERGFNTSGENEGSDRLTWIGAGALFPVLVMPVQALGEV